MFTGPQFARLLWLIEDLLYEDLLRGSGWGRRRGWFRDQLEATRNIAQVIHIHTLHTSLMHAHITQTTHSLTPKQELKGLAAQ